MFIIPIANAAVDMTKFGEVIDPIISNLVYPAVQLLFGAAIIVFAYGVLQTVIHGDDENAREIGKKTMLYGTIGMFIMVSAWGIIWTISNTVTELFK